MKIPRFFLMFSVVAAAAAMSLASCSKEEATGPDKPAPEPVPEPADSLKVSIMGILDYFSSSSYSSQRVVVNWHDADSVYVIGKATDTSGIEILGVLAASTATDAGSSSATLSGTIRRPGQKTALTLLCAPAVTPWPVVTQDGHVSFSLACQQGKPDIVPFVAYANVDYDGVRLPKSTFFDFAAALLKVSLRGQLTGGLEVTSAIIGQVDTVCTLDLSSGVPTVVSGGSGGVVTRNFTGLVPDSSGGATFYIALPVSPENADRTLAVLQKGGACREFRPVVQNAILPRRLCVLDYPDVFDLSAAGAANCYVVTAPGDYRFDATVCGNGRNPDGTVSASIAPVSADVLWESCGTATMPVVGSLVKNVRLSDGCVHFTAAGEKGNAVIAVRDASGNILWSWHIWLPDGKPAEQVYAGGAGTLMDRNLGAVSATGYRSQGFLYQWGRKDPFLGSCAQGGIAEVVSNPSPWSYVYDPVSSPSVAVRNPTTFHYALGGWLSPADLTLWNASKTKYDPCPHGYRVPDGGVGGVWNKAGFESKGAWSSDNCGHHFSVLSSSATTWYPAAGYRGLSDYMLHDVGGGGYYWSCTISGSKICRMTFTSQSVNPLSSYGNAGVGNSVRCQKFAE